MPTYVGFNTVNVNTKSKNDFTVNVESNTYGLNKPTVSSKKYRMTDEQLVVRNYINALSIRQGEKVGKPEYGTILWQFLFEPNTGDNQYKIEEELRRVASLDPRLNLLDIRIYIHDNGVLVEIQASVAPFNNYDIFRLFFNTETNTVLQQ